jgi:hypothetical protein
MSRAETRSLVRERLMAWWRQFRGPSTWLIPATMGFILALGFWLRARGYLYDVPDMWLDECSWAIMLNERPLVKLLIRPPGFIVLSRVFVLLFGPTEASLRAIPWLSAMAALAMAPFLARRLFSTAAPRLLFVAIIALHPAATDFAKEFKPYSTGLTLHMAIILLTLRYLETMRGKDLAWLLALAVVSPLLSQDLVFAFPGVFAIAGWRAFKHDRRHFLAVALAALVIVASLLAQYMLIWRHLPRDEADYWGKKYQVFYTRSQGDSYLSWLFEKYREVAAFPGLHSRYWKGALIPRDEHTNVRVMASVVWIFLHVAGVIALLWRRRFHHAVLAISPILVVIVFNRFGYWPFGAFRTSLFVLVHVGIIAAAALDFEGSRKRPVAAVLPAALLLVIPLLFFEDRWPPIKRTLTRPSSFRQVLEWLAKRPPPASPANRQILLLGRGYCDPWKYYLKYHPETRYMRSRLEQTYDVRCLRKRDPVLEHLRAAVSSSTDTTWLLRGRLSPLDPQPDLRTVTTLKFRTEVMVGYVRAHSTHESTAW